MIEYGMDADGEKVVLFFGPCGPAGFDRHYVFTIEGAQHYLAHLTTMVDRAIEIRNGTRAPGSAYARGIAS